MTLRTLAAAAAAAAALFAPPALADAPNPEPVAPPRLIGDLPQAAYPPGETRAARVVLALQLDAAGQLTGAAVVSDPQPPFDAAALQAARVARFEPATQAGKPLAVRIQLAWQFAPPAAPKAPEAGVLAGTLRERGTRRKLAGFELTATTGAGASAFTDSEGHFELSGLPPGQQQIVLAAAGYQRFEVTEVIAAGQRLEVAYLLEPLFASPYEAVVAGERARREISKTSISMAEIERIPGTQGDALKVVEDLPGVARTSPMGGGMLVIRGSKPGDSIVTLDGESLPLLYHFGALSGTVNSDLLAGIDYLPGNFGAGYGDLTGGLVEVRTRALRDETHGYANVSVLESSFLLEGPAPGVAGLTYAVAGRRSQVDALLKSVMSSSTASLTAAPRYFDGQLRLDWRPQGSAHQLSFLALTSNDALGMLFTRPWNDDPNRVGSLFASIGFSQVRLKHQWRAGAFSLESIAMWEALENYLEMGSEHWLTNGRALNLRTLGTGELSPELTLSVGMELGGRRNRMSARLPKSVYRREGEPETSGRPDEAPSVLPAMLYTRYAPGAWAELRWKPLPDLTVTPGVRLDAFVTDTGAAHGQATLSPRLAVRWEAGERLAFKGGAGLYTQGPRESDPLPVFGNPEIQPERALQLTAGVEARPLPGFFASVEGFWKKLDDLVVHTAAVDAQGTPLNLDNAGRGHARGLEVMLRKDLTDRAFGWIAYTLSRSDRVDRPGQALRLFDFDQTHNLTVVAGYKLGGGWQLGARLRVISGNPLTPVTGAAWLASTDSYLPTYGATNSARAPAFSQLDLRLDRTWTFDSWMLDAYVDVLNTTNHRSIEGTAYSFDYAHQAPIEGLPILPSLGLKGSF